MANFLGGNQTSLSDQVAAYLLNEIFSGNLEQGEHITESTLVEKFECSHAPVREALYILEAKGVVERFPRKGVRVRVFSEKELNDHFEALIGLFELSCRIIEDLTGEMKDQFKTTFAKITEEFETKKDLASYVNHSGEFILLFATFSGNTVYERATEDTLFITNIFAQNTWTDDFITEHYNLQKQALEAIEDSDIQQAFDSLSNAIELAKN